MALLSTLPFLVFSFLLVRPAFALPQDFTDGDFRKTLEQESRVLFYSFSPGMPLSIEGLKEVRNAAKDLHAKVVFVVDPLTAEADIQSIPETGDILRQIKYQKSQLLRDLGIQLHYPSLVVSSGHRVVGAPIPGYKSRAGYVTLVSDLLKLKWQEAFQVSASLDLPRPMTGSFFKPLYGTDFVIIGWGSPSYLFNLKTKEPHYISPAVGGDAGASPDGEFITFIGGGLSWLSVRDIMARAPTVLLHDPGLRTYQSMGLVRGSSLYRVLGAESSSTRPTGLLFRDYRSAAREDGGKTVTPVTTWEHVCDSKRISIPMMSKTGLYLSGLHEGTLRVFRIGEEGKDCEEVFDSKVVAGKADFSVDDRFLVYVSRAEDPGSKNPVDTIFLADLATNQVKPVYYGTEASQLFFPAFLNQDQIVVYDRGLGKMTLLERTRKID